MLKMYYEKDKKKKLKDADERVNVDDLKLGSLDLFDDPKMEQFFTRGIRGGQSFISVRHSVGSSNPSQKGNHLLYVDGNIF